MNSPFSRTQIQEPSKPTLSMKKVVSIPVQFIHSDSKRYGSALKIQKIFRSFLVRTSTNKIRSIKRKVDEIERRISSPEAVELIRKNEREKLRINESLMALLFELDSVHGVDYVVRDCRKRVIKKAIALQEKVDSIGTDSIQILDSDQSGNGSDSVDRTLEIKHSVENGNESSQDSADQLTDGNCTNSCVEEVVLDSPILEADPDKVQGTKNEPKWESGSAAEGVDPECFDNSVDGSEVCKVENEDCDIKEIVENCNAVLCGSECVEENPKGTENVEGDDLEVKDWLEFKGKEDNNKSNRELLERMVEDNEKMMRLMTQLYERSETQTRMINTLTHRVEQLEKAFVCDTLRRKKKKHHGP